MELKIRIESVNQDNSHSWVRISYGTIKYVVDSNSRQHRNSCRSTRSASTTNKCQGYCSKIKDKSKNHKRGNLLTNQVSYRCTKENGLTLSHQHHLSLHTKSRRKSLIFFDTIKQYGGKTMEQLNSTVLNFIFEIIIHKYSIGLMIVGKFAWQQEEDQKEDISIALIFQEQFFTSVLFRNTLDVISLILYYKSM